MMKTTSSVRHLKLVTGEEIICEVLDESAETIVVNNAMSLMQNTLKSGEKFFTFKTYMVYQDTPLNCIIIFTDKIMSLAVPAKEMIQQYSTALKEMACGTQGSHTMITSMGAIRTSIQVKNRRFVKQS